MELTQRDIAAALGVTPAMVCRWRAKGMPTTSTEAAAAWRAEHVRPRAQAAGNPVRRVPAAPAGQAVPSYSESRARREHAEALRAERAAALEAGELVRVEDVKRLWARACSEVKERFLGLPDRVAPLVTPMTEQSAVAAALASEVHEILQLLHTGGRR
jgi:hypothetical protein